MHRLSVAVSLLPLLFAACGGDKVIGHAATPVTTLGTVSVTLSVTNPFVPQSGMFPYQYEKALYSAVVWVVDAGGQYVTTASYYAHQGQYLAHLSNAHAWDIRLWHDQGGRETAVDAVSSATYLAPTNDNPYIKYTVTWTGKDAAGAAVPAGTYGLRALVMREGGTFEPHTTLYGADVVVGAASSSNAFVRIDSAQASNVVTHDTALTAVAIGKILMFGKAVFTPNP